MPAPQSKHTWRRYALLGVVTLALASCASETQPLNSLDPQGPIADRIDGLFWMVFWIAVAVFVVVQTALIVAVVVFRDRNKADQREPKQVHGNAVLEVVWTAIPTLILAGIAVPTVSAVFDLADCPSDAFHVEVIGHQWWFEYHYPDYDITTANVLVIPAGTEVCADLSSDDVIHNFWIPKLNGKRYLVPGQATELRLNADEPGEYWGHCAEFCGLSHAKMRARVIAYDQADFDAWVTEQQAVPEPPAEGTVEWDGLQVFNERGCTSCHVLGGVNEPSRDELTVVAPNLTHFASRHVFAGATLPAGLDPSQDDHDAALREWLADPPTVKPGSFMPNLGLTADEIDALVAYLGSLK